MRKNKNSSPGQSLLEMVLAMAVFAFMVVALVSLSVGGFRGLIQGGQRTAAEAIAQEGIEAARAIRDRAWNENTFTQTGVELQANQWRFSGAPQDVIGAYTRILRFNPVCRNLTSVVVVCGTPGALEDINTREMVVSVTWQTPYGATDTIEKRAFITNWDSREWRENSTTEFADGTFGSDTQASSLSDGASVTLREQL